MQLTQSVYTPAILTGKSTASPVEKSDDNEFDMSCNLLL